MVAMRDVTADLNRETLVDRIVDVLEDRILTGELEPKTKLSETRVANEFGVSRAPAREALQRLQEMNLVRKTYVGREVVSFSLKEFREIYELKNVIEAFGAMKGTLNATERDIKKIQSVMNNMTKCLDLGELNKLRGLNYEFHDLLVKCSGNQRLIETYTLLVKQIRWAISFLPPRTQKSFNEHRSIFEAFKQREAEKVRVLLETHSNDNWERILSQLKNKQRGKSIHSPRESTNDENYP